MKDNRVKIDTEIYIVFIVLIAVSVFNAFYSTLIISRNQDASTKIMAIDVPSLQALENMNLVVTRSKMYITNWIHLEGDQEDKDKLKLLQDKEYPKLKTKLMAYTSFWGDPKNHDALMAVFTDFEKLISQQKKIMRTLVRFDDYEDPMKKFSAEDILENQVLPGSNTIMAQLDEVIRNRKNLADISHSQMTASSRSLMGSVLVLAVLIVVVVLLAGFYFSNSIIVPVMKLRNYILQMGRGELPEIKMTPRTNAVGQMAEAVKTLKQNLQQTAQFANSVGAGDFKAKFEPLSESDELGNALIQMSESLYEADQANKLRNWEAAGIAEINKQLHQYTDNIEKLSDELVKTLAYSLEVSNAGFYLLEDQDSYPMIKLKGGYALSSNVKQEYHVGEGYIGQAIKDRESIHIIDIPREIGQVNSGIGEISSNHLLVMPVMHQGNIYGAIELVSFRPFEDFKIAFVKHVGEIIGSVIASSIANSLTKKLLQETQEQAGQLKLQEEELMKTNEELEGQSRLLKVSREELKLSNEELKTKADELQSQNERLEQAREALSVKARELEINSKYKSEFLANMSHELRTPLNSVLILAKLLTENKNKNLNEKEAEYARVIHKSGSDLLSLINEILDLSKVEAGKIEIVMQATDPVSIKENMLDLFSPQANEKKIEFQTDLNSDLPREFQTDQFRLEQVLKNLLSNAMKFTPEKGTVTLRIKSWQSGTKRVQFDSKPLLEARNIIEFSVQDSGIGIATEKQQFVFEAFSQADGSTSRKYGGTGLGLSISKMLISMLGGEIKLESEAGKGSMFSVFLPLDAGLKGSSAEVDSPSSTIKDLNDENKAVTDK